MVTARTVTFIKVSDSAVSDRKECHVTNIHAHVFFASVLFSGTCICCWIHVCGGCYQQGGEQCCWRGSESYGSRCLSGLETQETLIELVDAFAGSLHICIIALKQYIVVQKRREVMWTIIHVVGCIVMQSIVLSGWLFFQQKLCLEVWLCSHQNVHVHVHVYYCHYQ